MGSEAPDRRVATPRPYADPIYAAAFGVNSLWVPEWGTPVLVRPIPETSDFDAIGCYPLAALDPEANIKGGLARLGQAGLVSVVLVPDPLHSPALPVLEAGFPICRPYKTHFILDRSLPRRKLSVSHAHNIRLAKRACEVVAMPLQTILGEWIDLYRNLVRRQGIVGLANFSDGYFETLTRLEGLTTFVALQDGEPVAASLWVRYGDSVYYHLTASSEKGYRTRAVFAIAATAIDHFSDCAFVHFGGGAGTGNAADGLAYFKRGFANREMLSYICGAVLAPARYERLAAERSSNEFFPSYRTP